MIERLNAALEGRYRIERELGQGGMATVYLAEDIKHDRKVALKVLKPELAAVVGGDRFLTEIKTTANLAHPNILPLFDSGEADSFLYYVMPYVEGESLRDRLDREKQLGVEDSVRLAREVAEALHHAHTHGVVHRDIKPANILLQDGRPLVSDFGIALAVSQAGGGRLTETGLSMGTPHYMSPEQASGDRDVDPRTDVYSLGCVLFEMLTGEPPYGGGTAQAVLARILTGTPDRPTEIRGTIPRHVEAVILKAMEKLPADRFESTETFAKALGDQSFRHGEAAGAGVGGVAGVWKPAALAAGAVAVLALAWAGWLATRSEPEPAPPPATTRSVFDMPPGQELEDVFGAIRTFSRDGSLLVYLGPDQKLWLKERGRQTARPLEGTTGAAAVSIDPTGRWLAFVQSQALRKLPLGGGPSVVLADSVLTGFSSVAWLDDGQIAYTNSSFELSIVPAEGGTSRVLWSSTKASEGVGAVSPGPGGTILFVVCDNFCRNSAQLYIADPAVDDVRLLLDDVLRGWWLETGHLALARPGGSLFVVRFDPETLEIRGEPAPTMEGIQVDQGVIADITVGESGQILARMGAAGSQLRGFYWVDREGNRTAVDPEFTYELVTFPGWRLSPDDRFVAFARSTDSGDDIWVKELDAGPVFRLTFDEGSDFRPEWIDGGESILFVSDRTGTRELYRRRSNATGPVERVLARETDISQGTFSPDGEWLVYREGTADGRNIFAIRPGQDSLPAPLIANPGYDEKAAAISPDGRWIAYESDETGQDEIYVRPFPAVEEGKWQVSVGGGRDHVWAHSGREIFYVNRADSMIAAQIDPGPPFRVGSRTPLFSVEGVLFPEQDHTSYDVAGDDRRFLLSVPITSDADSENYWLMVDHWSTELAELDTGQEDGDP